MAVDYKTRRARPAGFSGWSGLAIGLVVGLAVAGIVYVRDHEPRAIAGRPVKAEKKRPSSSDARGTRDAEDTGAGAAEPPAMPAKSYDFYKMLPNFEVVVPKNGKDVKPDVRPAPETRPGTYVLQAGSYKDYAEADRVRAQLALQGIESKVQKVSVDNDTWHRIRIGPVSNLDELNRMRQILRKAKVEVLVIRVGD